MSHPFHRPRRLRRTPGLRELVADVGLRPSNLIAPLFVADLAERRAIPTLPGAEQLPVGEALAAIRRLGDVGIGAFLLFGVTEPGRKDGVGSHAHDPESPVLRLVREAREAGVSGVLIPDLCLCEYTDHGHCGPLAGDRSVDNDATLARLGAVAVAQARAGADLVAPSGMMDGQVGAIRAALDAEGFEQTGILSYAIKYASAFYGPFRDAGGGHMAFGDRKGYQMDPRRSREWRTELDLDLEQGADLVMVKPAATYLDIVAAVRGHTDLPVAAYHTSGEYAMVEAAAREGLLDRREAHLETAFAIRRAGADLIVSYAAADLAGWVG
ncbi:porphobilinogen synthase [Mucisphaera sp.]|uniref:porphobilinogen synthase n=1 Tax=Mucisphaera sp. TaxID=2913024 RepID=UPI003D0EC14B